ncbi:odorant receptor 10-like [Calliopsis andreniformis]|uniref:odorant receptor 10-like n=1 Tax=Calliopsis andreniformis TaxID=337506 RepID=UPI003FCD7BA1
MNIHDCVFVACNILYLMIVFYKIIVLCIHKKQFYELVLFTEKNFWHSNYNVQEKLILTDCRRICGIFIIVLSFCAQGTCAGYMVTPLLANIGRNESDRILPFNMWVNFPTGLSPYFEILFTIQVLCVYHVGTCYICFDNFLCLVNLHVASQFRILQYRLKNLTDSFHKEADSLELEKNQTEMCYKKLRSCVQQHQMLIEYCSELENVFTLIVLGQVLFLAMIICLVGYQLFLNSIVTHKSVKKILTCLIFMQTDSPPSRSVSLVLNLGGTMCQLLMFTYSCDGLVQQSSNIGRAIFSGPWTTLPMNKVGRTVRRNIIIITLRTTRCCSLTASGFFPVSLETYTGILSTAMSYFTLLRNSSLDVENALD